MALESLNDWLSQNYSLTAGDLNIRLPKIIENASRYSKEDSRSKTEPDFEKFIEGWLVEVERSAKEDAAGIDREGQDPHIAESMAETRRKLLALGEITLDQFPFHEIPPSIKNYMRRALQKELSRSIAKAKDLDRVSGAMLYTNKELQSVLENELGREG